jgi:hypothetical protein
VRNKANSGLSRWGRRAKHAKRSQTREDWGIWEEGRPSYARRLRRKCAKQTQFPAAPSKTGARGRVALAPNKANCQATPRRVNTWQEVSYGELDRLGVSAEQSQFPPAPAATGPRGPGQSCQTNPIWPVGRDSGGPIVQNEPNFGQSSPWYKQSQFRPRASECVPTARATEAGRQLSSGDGTGMLSLCLSMGPY